MVWRHELVAADPNMNIIPVYALKDQAEYDSHANEKEKLSEDHANAEADSSVEWMGDEYVDKEYEEVLDAYMRETSKEDDKVINKNTKVTRSGKVYIANLKSAVLSATTTRISMKKAMILYKQKALDSMFGELSVINEKAIDPDELTKGELNKMIRSFMFLSQNYDADGNLLK